MLAFLGNLGPFEMVIVAIVAILVFGKNLPEAAAKTFVQLRKLRNAMDDLKRDTGIEKEMREIQRTVREAEWEARRPAPAATLPRSAATTATPETHPEKTAEEDPKAPPPEDPPTDPLAERRASWRP